MTLTILTIFNDFRMISEDERAGNDFLTILTIFNDLNDFNDFITIFNNFNDFLMILGWFLRMNGLGTTF